MLLTLYLNFCVIATAYILSRRLLQRPAFADFLLTWFLFYYSLIVAGLLLLGWLHLLYSAVILAVYTVIFLCGLVLNISSRNEGLKIPDLLFIRQNRILLLCLSAGAAFFGVKVWHALINPPLGADCLMYHLTYPVSWLKNHYFLNPMIIFGPGVDQAATNVIPYYPLNGEIFFFWLLFPLRSPFFATLAQVPFYFATVVAIYAVARKFGVQKTASAFIAGLWFLIPNVIKHIDNGAYVDIICAALFMMTVNALLLIRENKGWGPYLIFSLSFGLFLGTKATNVVWSLAILPLFIRAFASKHYTFSAACSRLLFIAAIVIPLGCYSYIRSYLLTGNLFYPVTLKVFGLTLMPGYIDRASFSQEVYPWTEGSFANVVFGEGLGGQLLLFILPATFIPLAVLWWKEKSRADSRFLLPFFFIPLAMFILYFGYLKIYWTRYLYPYLAIGMAAAGVFLDRREWGRGYLKVIGSLVILASLAEAARHFDLVVSLLLSALVFFAAGPAAVVLSRLRYIPRQARIFGGVAAILLVTAAAGMLHKRYQQEYYGRYVKLYEEPDVALAWQWLDRETGSGARIAYTGRADYFPLFGTGLKNEVYYVSVNATLPVPHFYPDGLYRKVQDYDLWKKNLLAQRTDYLLVYVPHECTQFPVEDQWAASHPDLFECKFANPKVRVYLVKK